MIRINLLPYRAARKKENIRKQIGIFFLSLLVVVAILLFYNMRLQKKIDVLNTKIAENKAMLAKFENQAKEVDRIKKAFNTLENKTKVIKDLEKKRNDAVFLLDNMTKLVAENPLTSESSSDKDNTPVKRLWFTTFEAKGNDIDIKGIAMDNKTVADFMTRLESSKLYKNVELKIIKQHEIRIAKDYQNMDRILRSSQFKPENPDDTRIKIKDRKLIEEQEKETKRVSQMYLKIFHITCNKVPLKN